MVGDRRRIVDESTEVEGGSKKRGKMTRVNITSSSPVNQSKSRPDAAGRFAGVANSRISCALPAPISAACHPTGLRNFRSRVFLLVSSPFPRLSL
jgi:hypothetical protein